MNLEPALLHALVGGLLIGAGAAVLVLFNGRVAGISGITSDVLHGARGESSWRVAFLLGLILPALIFGAGAAEFSGGTALLITAGLLVGVGTRVGSGCTSGHGVCGLANLSRRSLVATLVFMGVAMLTVFIRHHVVAS